MIRILVLLTLVVNCTVWCKPVHSKLPPTEAFKFMRKFGYLEQGTEDSEALYSEEAVVDAIKQVQKFGAIPQTGVVDNATMQLMLTPRCGVPDIQRPSEFRRRKRYVIAAPGWKKRNITYFVANWTPKIGEEAVMKNIQTALDHWGRYARLSFHHVPNPSADIIVAFGRGPHGDAYPFDGPGNILAHAFFPYEQGALGGDIHFDDDENWQINPSEYDDGVDFFTVAVHELGHSLGLGHSPVHESIMFPYYKGYSSTFALGYDDILAMYQLYIQTRLEGDDKTTEAPWEREPAVTEADHYPTATTHQPPITTTPQPTAAAVTTEFTYTGDYETVDEHKTHEPTSTTTVSPVPDICDGSYDAVATLRGELFVFKHEYVWRLHTRGTVEYGYPVPFRQLFPKLPESVTRIDAAYQRNKDGYIIMFSGNKYWVFDGDNFVEGSPRPLTDYGLPAVLDRIDAAQVWKKNGKVYFYRHEMFWRYNETSEQMDPGYPHHIKRWRGVPADLDAATTWTDGFTYFFKGHLFWRFDNYLIKTDERYPLPAPQTWMGCPEKPDTMFWLPPI